MRILFVSANPKWTDRLELADELRVLQQSLKGLKAELTLLPAAQPEDLEAAIKDGPIHIVHFSGHAEETGILLRDSEGFPKEVPGAELRSLFRDKGIKLAVLNACNTENTANELADTVDTIIATTEKVDDRAAKKLTKVLYAALAAGETLGNAYARATQSIDKAELPNVYTTAGDGGDASFSDMAPGEPEVDAESKKNFDQHFFVNYLDEQITSLERNVQINRVVLFGLLGLGAMMLLFGYVEHLWNAGSAWKTVWNDIRTFFHSLFGSLTESYEHSEKPLLDWLLAVGEGIPLVIASLQHRFCVHGNEKLSSLRALRDLAKRSDDLPEPLRAQLDEMLHQTVASAEKDFEPLFFGKSKEKSEATETQGPAQPEEEKQPNDNEQSKIKGS